MAGVATRWWVFTSTFFCFAAFHAMRKGFSNAKNNISDDWHFSESDLGALDSTFLFCYSAGLYISGYLGDRFPLIRVLVLGMLSTAATGVVFGFGRVLGLRSIYAYATIWGLNGLAQSTGWPTTVACMGNWFNESSRGRIFGLWAANASAGNIIGSLMVFTVVKLGGSIPLMFVVPGAFLVLWAAIAWFFVPEHPPPPSDGSAELSEPADALLLPEEEEEEEEATAEPEPHFGFIRAVRLPGVLAYSFSYAFLKFVNYSLFFWLAFYLHKSLDMSSSRADLVSNAYDVGQIFGGWVAGGISDRMGKRSPVTVGFMVVSVGLLAVFTVELSLSAIIVVLLLSGFFIGGPANLISSAISTDLGSHPDLVGNAKALATVTGIVDGTGSFGAAVGQYIVAYLSHHYTWSAVFGLLMAALVLSCLCLVPLLVRDIKDLRRHKLNVVYDEIS